MPASVHPDREELMAGQLADLRRLLAAIVPANQFYTKKFRDVASREIATLAEFSTKFPFTTKDELVRDQQANPAYGTNLTFPVEQYTRLHQTSGTRGQPMRWLDTPESWNWMVESWRKIFIAAGATKTDHIYFAFSFGPFIGFWLAYEAGQRLGALCIPGGGLSSEARLRAILENKVTILCCTPTYALRLAEVAKQHQIDLGRSCVRTIIVAGEPGGSIPATRKQLTELWHGARIFDHHGMTETGPVTYECPKQPGQLHVIESAYFAEIVNPQTGSPASLGETGELVLTTLGRIGSPLLRYKTGDLVKRIEKSPCACGSCEMALEGGILGRSDDMVIVRGVNVYPTAVEEIIRACGDIVEFRVHVSKATALSEIKVVIEPVPNCADPAAIVRRLEQMFSHALALRVPVEAVAPETLPRFEMKAKRWIVETVRS